MSVTHEMLVAPRKEIFNPDDMSKWLKSEAYQVSLLEDEKMSDVIANCIFNNPRSM